MVYEWKAGSRVKADAQIAGEMCQMLESEGRLSAKNLLDLNRPEDAPLHGEFEWNDTIAAESWREQQARHIINSLVICPENSEPVRSFFKIENAGNTYQSIHTILHSKDSTEFLFASALKELKAVQRKYSAIQQLAKVWDAIEKCAMGEPA